MSETNRTHPDEAALIAWLDEPGDAHPSIATHVDACAACAARIDDLRSILDGLAAPPEMPSTDAMAAAREKILAAIGGEPDARPAPAGRGGGSVLRLAVRAGVPLLAAAGIAALLLWSPGEEPPGPGAPAADVAAGSGASNEPATVVAEAEAAADAVVAALAEAPVEAVDEGVVALDDAAVESLAEIEASTATLGDEDDYEPTLLADRFASLSEEDRAAILDELSEMTFEL